MGCTRVDAEAGMLVPTEWREGRVRYVKLVSKPEQIQIAVSRHSSNWLLQLFSQSIECFPTDVEEKKFILAVKHTFLSSLIKSL